MWRVFVSFRIELTEGCTKGKHFDQKNQEGRMYDLYKCIWWLQYFAKSGFALHIIGCLFDPTPLDF